MSDGVIKGGTFAYRDSLYASQSGCGYIQDGTEQGVGLARAQLYLLQSMGVTEIAKGAVDPSSSIHSWWACGYAINVSG